jgi:hypothetical protein
MLFAQGHRFARAPGRLLDFVAENARTHPGNPKDRASHMRRDAKRRAGAESRGNAGRREKIGPHPHSGHRLFQSGFQSPA